ncbi:unnamed protein product [Agarophyton chilense]
MLKHVFRRGDLIVTWNRPVDCTLFLADGYICRLATGPDGLERQLKAVESNTVAELKVTSAAPLNASANRFRTPLLSQRANEINLSAFAVAPVVNYYYRSALIAIFSRRLSDISTPLFSNMHCHHPARVAVRFSKTIAPGVIITPISSILEAFNVGHVNSQPLSRRSLHGSVPRLSREVLFVVGLNQLSDYMEERYRSVAPDALATNMADSLIAGVVAGYLSQMPYNLSFSRLQLLTIRTWPWPQCEPR